MLPGPEKKNHGFHKRLVPGWSEELSGDLGRREAQRKDSSGVRSAGTGQVPPWNLRVTKAWPWPGPPWTELWEWGRPRIARWVGLCKVINFLEDGLASLGKPTRKNFSQAPMPITTRHLLGSIACFHPWVLQLLKQIVFLSLLWPLESSKPNLLPISPTFIGRISSHLLLRMNSFGFPFFFH